MKVVRLALAIATAAALAGCATEGNQATSSTASAQPAARSASATPAPAPSPHSAMGIMMGSSGARTAPTLTTAAQQNFALLLAARERALSEEGAK